MKIGYFADGPWSHLALDKIIHDKEMEVAFIVPRFDTQDPVLKKKSEELGIDFLPIKDVNTSESIEKLEEYVKVKTKKVFQEWTYHMKISNRYNSMLEYIKKIE